MPESEPPEIETDVQPLVVHESVEDEPDATEVGEALKDVIVQFEDVPPFTLTICTAECDAPLPVAVSLNVVVETRATVETDPVEG